MTRATTRLRRPFFAALLALAAATTTIRAETVIHDFESGTLPPAFVAGGDAPWRIDMLEPYAGSHALRSGAVASFGTSDASLALAVDVASTVSFAFRVRGFYDLEVYVDEVRVATHGQFPEWRRAVVELAAGMHAVRFSHRFGSSGGAEAGAWIDDVTIAPLLDADLRADVSGVATHGTSRGVPDSDVRLADLDGDGSEEILYVLRSSEHVTASGLVVALDSRTLREEWREPLPDVASPSFEGMDVAQLDADIALEVVKSTENANYPYDGRAIEVLDGRDGTLERRFLVGREHGSYGVSVLRVLDPGRALVASGDRLREIALSDGAVLWEGPAFDYPITALEVADLDGDGAPEAALLANGAVVVFDLATRLVELARTVPRSTAIAIDPSRRELFVVAGNEVIVYDVPGRRVARRLLALADIVGAWPAQLDGQALVFASTGPDAIEVFDATSGSRLGRTPTDAPGFARGASRVPLRIVDGSLRMWGRSDHRIDALDAKLGAPPLFADGFE